MPLNILHVINVISPKYGGAAIAPQLMANYQAKIGHNVTICTTNVDYPNGTLSVIENSPIHVNGVLTFHFKVSYRALLISLPMWKWLKSNINSYDIVHIHGLYRFPVTFAAWLSKKVCIPYLISPHGSLDPFLYKQSQYNVFLKRLYERFFDIPNLNNSAAIHYTTKEEAQRASFLGLRSKPVVVPNGIDWRSYKDLPQKGHFRKMIGINNNIKLILFLGRINFKKGLDLLIPAFRYVTNRIPDSHLAIVGPDNENYLRKVKIWCREQRIKSKVTFQGFLRCEFVKQAYIDADVFILPSYTENFGMTVVEAMACRCPVIISNRLNIWPEVRKAGAGTVVNLNIHDLANAMINMLIDKEAASEMGFRGRQLAKNQFTLPRVTKQLITYYQVLK